MVSLCCSIDWFLFVALDVVTVFIFQEPSLLSSIQDKGLTEVVLDSLLIKDVSRLSLSLRHIYRFTLFLSIVLCLCFTFCYRCRQLVRYWQPSPMCSVLSVSTKEVLMPL